MERRQRTAVMVFAVLFTALALVAGPTFAQDRKPNIIFIMGDDIGWFNIGAYHQGIMAGRTPNLDKLAAEGMRFTDYYAEASCTAGRANFITGRTTHPHRAHDSRPGRGQSGHARRCTNHCHCTQVHGLRHRAVRKEPSWRHE